MFWKNYFGYFGKFLSGNVETIETDTKLSRPRKSKVVQRKPFRKWFWSYLELKNECSELWKWHFSIFCKFLGDEVKTIFWESEAKRWKLFKRKFNRCKFFRKWFWSYIDLKNECSEPWNWHFSVFLRFFGWQTWNRSLAKQDITFKKFHIKFPLLRAF